MEGKLHPQYADLTIPALMEESCLQGHRSPTGVGSKAVDVFGEQRIVAKEKWMDVRGKEQGKVIQEFQRDGVTR